MNKTICILIGSLFILLSLSSCVTFLPKKADTVIYQADSLIPPAVPVQLSKISSAPTHLLNGMTNHFPGFITALAQKNGLELVSSEEDYKLSIHVHQHGILIDLNEYNDVSIVFTLWHKSRRVAEAYYSEITTEDFESFTVLYEKIDSLFPDFIKRIQARL